MRKALRQASKKIGNLFSGAHFYSPVVDVEEIKQRAKTVWPADPKILDIDFNNDSHHFLLTKVFPQYLKDFNYPTQPQQDSNKDTYYINNGQFGWLDAPTLYVFLRWLKPKVFIEVGSGFSSLLVADVNKRYLGNDVNFICIEPFPRDFLARGVDGISKLVVEKVQTVKNQEYERLESGDVLFIDSSHVSKTGSDVNHLFFEVLPRLKSGVYIHIHDIFLPHDYPKHWVLDGKRSWNEQYLLRALLMNSNAYEVVFGCSYAHHRFGKVLAELFDGKAFGGGSFWIRKK